ncbi:MAG: sensor histidine kinase [Deltaproteobacteria bacterium]|nr:sensor histidine kinase [Deltaproteobacteria bacterium]
MTNITYLFVYSLIVLVVFLIGRLVSQREAAKTRAEDTERRLMSLESNLSDAVVASREFDRARKMLHDVRGSLNPIICYAYELSEIANKIGEPWLKKVSSAIRLQTLYTADIAKFNVQASTFDLAELLRYLSSLHSSILPDGAQVIFADTGQKQVISNRFTTVFRLLVNIIDNAKREAEKAGDNVRIEMDEKEIKIANRFTGEAPSKDIYRDGFTTKESGEENGIGLSSVLECADQLNVKVYHECVGDVLIFHIGLPQSVK